MGRPKGSGKGLVTVGCTVEPEVFAALREYADGHEITISEAVRTLLRTVLLEDGQLGALSDATLEDTGYQEGIRRGLHAFRVLLHKEVSKLWRR